MDTFVDSSWYFMRFTDPHNTQEPFSKEKCDHLMPVDLYIGGKEHAILHLYYARFLSHFCADIGMTMHREPFKKLLAQGIIKGKTFKVKNTGKYLHKDEVTQTGDVVTETSSGEIVETSFEKMSKSKLNGVEPGDFVGEWGITLTRLFVLYAAAPYESIHWDVKTDIIPGVMRWQMKLWRSVGRLLEARQRVPYNTNPTLKDTDSDIELKIAEDTNFAIKQVTSCFEETTVLSAAVTSLMTVARSCMNVPERIVEQCPEYERSVCAQVVMATPMMPHFTSELWEGLRGMKYKLTNQHWDKEVLDQSWPTIVDLGMMERKRIIIKVNGKRCTVLRTSLSDDVKELVLRNNDVIRRLNGERIIDFVSTKRGKQTEINIISEKKLSKDAENIS